MRKYLLLSLCLLFVCVFTEVSVASDKIVLNKENAQTICKAALQNDSKAIGAILNADCFNSEKVDQKTNGVVVNSHNPTKTIEFDDGSIIKIELKTTALSSDSWIGSCTETFTVGGIDWGSYVISAQWHKDTSVSSPDAVIYDSSWDSGRARFPLSLYTSGTTPAWTSGSYIKVWGTGGWSGVINLIPIEVRRHYEFKGYTGGYCEMEEIDSYPGCPS